MAAVYILNCKDFKPYLLSLQSRISDKRRQRTLKMRKKDPQLLCIGAEVCLSVALGLPLPLEYQTEQGGKPFIERAPQFNISHSGDYVVCAVDEKPIGADIERINRMKESIFNRIASPREKEKAATLKEDQLLEYYCTVWTKKESILKLTGEGIRKELSTVCTESEGCYHTEKTSDYVLSVCLFENKEIETHFITEEILKKHFNI
ncbi:MAG: 4'-phosphopantetheinyl transferase superfamily protein [Oscillospiraceae bacterium]|nr:4'-phosphopantetheinyl transferase superfamily protein [Oscillospiraceae bacterium]